MMRPAIVIAMLASLSAGYAPALAFQEMPEAPPPEASAAPAVNAPAAQLQSPGTSPSQSVDQSGSSVFNFGILPKFDIGLELMYGDKQQDLQQGAITDDNQDVTVLGKVKRRF